MRKIFILFIVLVFSNIKLFTDIRNMKFQRLDINKKISSPVIYRIFQDKTGFLWIGTNNGLNRYDGKDIKVYQNQPFDTTSISDNSVYSITEDFNENLWIGTLSRGLNKFDKKMGRFFHYKYSVNDKSGISGNAIYSLLFDSRGNLWIGTNGGINIYDEKKDVFFNSSGNLHPNILLLNNEIRVIYEDSKKNIWIGTTSGLFRYNNGQGRPEIIKYHKKNPLSVSYDRIQSILEDQNGILWVGTSEGLFEINQQTQQILTFTKEANNPNSIKSNNILSIFEDSEKNLWIGTSQSLELYHRDDKRFIHYQTDKLNTETISDNCINCIYEDRSKNVWFGTWNGINNYSILIEKFYRFKNDYRNPNLLKSDLIYYIFQDTKNNIWVNTDKGINIFKSVSSTLVNISKPENKYIPLLKDRITSMIEDASGNLWFGTTSNGVKKFDPDKKIVKNYILDRAKKNSLSDIAILKVYEDKSQNIWIGTNSNGLNRYDIKNDAFIHYKYYPKVANCISSNRVKEIYEDSKGCLWIGTNNGLNLFDREKELFTIYRNEIRDPNSLSNNIISFIGEDNLQNLWVGTSGGGLNKFDREKNSFIHYTKKNGLSGNTIFGILCDNAGLLWVSTDGGLSKIDPVSGRIKNYDKSDVLKGNNFSASACFKASDGSLFFGGDNGFIRFFPDKIEDNPNIPNIIISKIKKFDGKETIIEDIFNYNEIYLSYEDIYFIVEFSALDFTLPERNQYAYKLEGLDDNWIYCGNNNTATFTKVSGGAYTLRVKASNNDGIWNETGVSLRIKISSPPWERWWAYLIYILSFIGLTAFVIVKRNKARIKRSEEMNTIMKYTIQSMEKEREWIAMNLHDSVNQKILAVNNYLVKILFNFTATEDNRTLLRTSSATLLNAVKEIRNISQKNYPVELRKFGLIAVIENLINDFIRRTKVNVNFTNDDVDRLFGMELCFNIYRIIQEVFNNIEKHSKATEVNLYMKKIDKFLEIRIADNGVGFDISSYQNKVPLRKNFGLDIMEHRAILFKGQFHIESARGKGTIILIRIPIEKKM